MHGMHDPGAGAAAWGWLAVALMLAGAVAACASEGGTRPGGTQASAPAGGAAGAQAGSPAGDKTAPGATSQPWAVTPSGELARPLMPDRSLEPPADQVPVLLVYGQGVQRYVCKEKEQAKGSFEWTLKEPVAKLSDAAGREIGHHSAGPTWQLADGSKAVKKKLVASVPALAFDAVPWLLIEIESSGKGGLAGTRYVQRMDTVGGAPPSAGCDAAHAGATQDVDYRATYLFYSPRKSS
jgi:Protein of unknown function (DUF3455)